MRKEPNLKLYNGLITNKTTNWPKKCKGSLSFWKKQYDAGRLSTKYYEDNKKAILRSLHEWEEYNGKKIDINDWNI